MATTHGDYIKFRLWCTANAFWTRTTIEGGPSHLPCIQKGNLGWVSNPVVQLEYVMAVPLRVGVVQFAPKVRGKVLAEHHDGRAFSRLARSRLTSPRPMSYAKGKLLGVSSSCGQISDKEYRLRTALGHLSDVTTTLTG